jgi:cytochrome P450
MTATLGAVRWPAWEDPGFYAQEPQELIHASIAAQRREAPVHFYEAPGCTSGFWVLSKWEHQRYVGSHPEIFSNRFGFAVGDANDPAGVIDQLPAWVREPLSAPDLTPAQTRGLIAQGKLSLGDPELKNMMLMDPPRHAEVRSIFMRALRPSLVRGLRARMAEVADEIIGAIEPGTETDFVTTVGRIPATLMTEVIGVPRADRESFIEMAGAHIRSIAVAPGKDPEEIRQDRVLAVRFADYIDALLEAKRDGGGDDLISVISRAELDGAPLSRGIAFVFMTHFLSSGETTRTLLSHMAMELAAHPDQRAQLVDQPELIPNAMEETLRYDVINWSGCRTALTDVQIGGQLISRDDYVLMAYTSANRDEDVWERPDAFDVARSFSRDHLGFGHGEHSCPGALLARTVTRAIYTRLLERFPHWELAAEPQRLSSPFVQSMASLPMRFSA